MKGDPVYLGALFVFKEGFSRVGLFLVGVYRNKFVLMADFRFDDDLRI